VTSIDVSKPDDDLEKGLAGARDELKAPKEPLKRLNRFLKLRANLLNPNSVKKVIASQNWSDSGKEMTVYVYDSFAKWLELKWDRPRYKAVREFPFIPHKQEINDLIVSCNKRLACFLQILKETGARPGEDFNLKWIDFDLEAKTIVITPEEGNDPRIFKVSSRLANTLFGYMCEINGIKLFRKRK